MAPMVTIFPCPQAVSESSFHASEVSLPSSFISYTFCPLKKKMGICARGADGNLPWYINRPACATEQEVEKAYTSESSVVAVDTSKNDFRWHATGRGQMYEMDGRRTCHRERTKDAAYRIGLTDYEYNPLRTQTQRTLLAVISPSCECEFCGTFTGSFSAGNLGAQSILNLLPSILNLLSSSQVRRARPPHSPPSPPHPSHNRRSRRDQRGRPSLSASYRMLLHSKTKDLAVQGISSNWKQKEHHLKQS